MSRELTDAAAEAAAAFESAPSPVLLFEGEWMAYAAPGELARLRALRPGELAAGARAARRGARLRFDLGLRLYAGEDDRHGRFARLSRCVRNEPLTRCRCAEDAIAELGVASGAKSVRARAEVLHARFAQRLERARAARRRAAVAAVPGSSSVAAATRMPDAAEPPVAALEPSKSRPVVSVPEVEEQPQVTSEPVRLPAADLSTQTTSFTPARLRSRKQSSTADLREREF
jgi:hypothetical protein